MRSSNGRPTWRRRIALLPKLLTHRRSRGVLVPAGVAKTLRKANALRAAGDWRGAALLFAHALRSEPAIPHIWIQLGHAHKELREHRDATTAYARAAAFGSEGGEPYLHLGHVAKLSGNLGSAAKHYGDAFRIDPTSLAAATELMRCVDTGTEEGKAIVAAAAKQLEVEVSPRSMAVSDDRPRIYLDVSDLMSYFSHARLPTGIQRVQIELATALLHSSAKTVIHICCYAEARGGWTELPRERFISVSSAALTSDDRDDPPWKHLVILATLGLAADTPIRFADRDVLLNLGTSWSEGNYFLHLRNAREQAKIAYFALVYDLIPTIAPHWFPASLVRDYLGWLTALVDHADGYLAISQATKADLLRTPGLRGLVTVVPLDAEFRSHREQLLETCDLAGMGLEPGRFVLMVSTIEPRKNHIGALKAWLALAASHGENEMPVLVCVGGSGWMNDHVHAFIAKHPVLQRKVRLMRGVGDAELDLLYRHCLLTLYASLYEGWGLPVTESLCYHKVAVVSRNSSLVEAGGPFAAYFDAEDVASLPSVLEPLIFDDKVREAREAHIRANFKPRPWADLAEAALAGCRLPDMITARTAPLLHEEVRYSFALPTPDGSRSGEQFRVGLGWQTPSEAGSGLSLSHARLRLHLPSAAAPRQLRLRLSHQDGNLPRDVTMRTGRLSITERLGRDTSRWMNIPMPPAAGTIDVEISLSGQTDDRRGGDVHLAEIALCRVSA